MNVCLLTASASKLKFNFHSFCNAVIVLLKLCLSSSSSSSHLSDMNITVFTIKLSYNLYDLYHNFLYECSRNIHKCIRPLSQNWMETDAIFCRRHCCCQSKTTNSNIVLTACTCYNQTIKNLGTFVCYKSRNYKLQPLSILSFSAFSFPYLEKSCRTTETIFDS